METTQTAPETTQTPAAPETEPSPLWTGPKKRRKWIKRVLVIAAVLALLFWIVVRPMLGGTAAVSGAYQTAQVQRQDLTVSVSGSGTVTPIESYQVSALVTGEILESPFEDGDQVEKDQLLYRIDPGSAQTALQQAQLSVQQAQMNYDTLASSLQVKAIGGGVVQTLHVQEGDLVSAGTAIADITDTSTMTLTVPFQAGDAAHISAGQTAQVTLSGTLETLSGTVESVASADQVGNGGALVRQVKIRLTNPGALTETTSATARVGTYACAAGGTLSPPAAADHHRRRQRGNHQPERVRGQPGVRRDGAGHPWGRVRGELPGRRRPGRPERPALPPERPGGPGQLHHHLPHLGHRH